MIRWGACVGVLSSLLLHATSSRALPSQRCETIEVVDHEGMSQQLGLPQLLEQLKTIPLTLVPNGVPADVRIDLTFSPASSAVHAAIKTSSETESVELQSGRVRALEDFQARRRTLQPMQPADAEAFREQIVAETKRQIDACKAAVVASQPDGPAAVTAAPERAAPPAQLIAESAGPTARPPAPPSPPPPDAVATKPKPLTSPKKQAGLSPYWWLSAPLALILALTARAVIKKR